jgi:hypothetical protein
MEKTKHSKLSKGCKFSKRVILNVFTMAVMCCMFSVNAFADGEAASGAVDASSFITTACTVLKSVICLIGAGVGIWGLVNLLEGYGNDNPGAKAP